MPLMRRKEVFPLPVSLQERGRARFSALQIGFKLETGGTLRRLACTGLGKKVVPRLRECWKQGQAEVISKSSNEIDQTWGAPCGRALYSLEKK